MSRLFSHLGLVLALSLTAGGNLLAQPVPVPEAAKPTGPAAKKAADLVQAYTARIEKEIEQGRKEVERLRSELHELIDVRYAMAEAIAELRAEMATKGTYSGDPVVPTQAAPKVASPPAPGTPFHRDFVYGLGSALPKEPTVEQREQLRRLAPRSDLKRMIERLRAEVDETRSEVDQLAYKLLELSAGIPASFHGMGGGMMGGMGGGNGQWFGSMGLMGGMM
jgi:chorismate mutase